MIHGSGLQCRSWYGMVRSGRSAVGTHVHNTSIKDWCPNKRYSDSLQLCSLACPARPDHPSWTTPPPTTNVHCTHPTALGLRARFVEYTATRTRAVPRAVLLGTKPRRQGNHSLHCTAAAPQQCLCVRQAPGPTASTSSCARGVLGVYVRQKIARAHIPWAMEPWR